jgi:hypothetical protein
VSGVRKQKLGFSPSVRALRAFSGKVGTGFPQKMRQNQKPRSLSDSIDAESDLEAGLRCLAS